MLTRLRQASVHSGVKVFITLEPHGTFCLLINIVWPLVCKLMTEQLILEQTNPKKIKYILGNTLNPLPCLYSMCCIARPAGVHYNRCVGRSVCAWSLSENANNSRTTWNILIKLYIVLQETTNFLLLPSRTGY